MGIVRLKPKKSLPPKIKEESFKEMRPLSCDLTQEIIIGAGLINMHGQVVQFMPFNQPRKPNPGDRIKIALEIKIPFKPQFFTKEGRKG